MTVKSMTGFGRGELERDGRVWVAEIRCVNNRYLDLKMKLPRGYASIEDRIRKLVSEFHQRGRVDLMLSVSGDFSDLQEVSVNLELARGYQAALTELADGCGVEGGGQNIELLSSWPDVIVRRQRDEDIETIWGSVEQVIREALVRCDEMRLTEGEALRDDLSGRLNFFSTTVGSIETHVPELIQQRQDGLRERLEKLLGNVQLDPQRLALEIAIIADKTDVTEEIVRLRSHMEQFQMFLAENGAIGRKLDFLIQEFLREVNTLASKINDAGIAHLTVDLKSELEKMREQVQNIE